MAGIKFSRQLCADDPNFMDVHIRMPCGPEHAQYCGDYEGEEAQKKVTNFILATASGMLTVIGAPAIANAVEHVGRLMDEELAKDSEKRAGMN